MRKSKIPKNKAKGSVIFMVALFLTAGSCNKEVETKDFENIQKPVSFTAFTVDNQQTSAARATDNEWDYQDSIGIFAVKNGKELPGNIVDNNANLKFETSGDGVFYSKDKNIYFPKDGSAMDIIAYYPYTNKIENYKYPIDIQEQTELLYSNNLKGISKKSTQKHVLQFKHVLSKLMLNITPKHGEESLEGMTVTLSGGNTTGSLDLSTGEIIIDRDSKKEIALQPTGDQFQKQISAFLFPTKAGENLKVKFSFPNDKSFTWDVPHQLESGKKYSYNIQLENTGVEVVLNGYMEIPKYTSADEAPHSIKALHMVENRNWLNPSFTYGSDPIRNYTVLYDTENRVPYWIAFPMHPMYLASGNRTDHWDFDLIIPQEYQPSLFSSWSTRELDRGHLLASADRNATREINKTTFYFTNMVPQNNTMNSGNWADLETKVRNWTSQVAYDTLYVVTGTILPKVPQQFTYTTDDNGRQSLVPTHLYKALLRKHKATGKYTSIAFKMENNDSGTHYSQTAISVSELEEETGFTFFDLLPPSEAAAIKQNKTISPHWN